MDDRAYRWYASLPSSLQDVAVSLHGWRRARVRYGQQFEKYLAFLEESEDWSLSRYRRLQGDLLRELARFAYETPFYRRAMDEAGVRPEDVDAVEALHRFPMIDRQIVRRETDALRSPRLGSMSWRQVSTSGTTGRPLKLAMEDHVIARQRAVWWRHRGRFDADRRVHEGVRFSAKPVVPASQESPPYWRRDRYNGVWFLSIYHIRDSTVPEIADWLSDVDIDYFEGYPGAIHELAWRLHDQDITVSDGPEWIFGGAGQMHPQFVAMMEDVFGATATEHYGMVEACGNISRCEQGTWHVDEEFGIVEFPPLECEGDESLSRIVCTGLWNRAMPLIRYDTGDVARVGSVGCDCGRRSRTVEAIVGRVDEFLLTGDGRRLYGLNQIMKEASGARELQFVQTTPDEIVVRVVRGPDYSREDEECVIAALTRRAASTFDVRFSYVSEIPTTSGGKKRSVVRHLADP